MPASVPPPAAAGQPTDLWGRVRISYHGPIRNPGAVDHELAFAAHASPSTGHTGDRRPGGGGPVLARLPESAAGGIRLRGPRRARRTRSRPQGGHADLPARAPAG